MGAAGSSASLQQKTEDKPEHENHHSIGTGLANQQIHKSKELSFLVPNWRGLRIRLSDLEDTEVAGSEDGIADSRNDLLIESSIVKLEDLTQQEDFSLML